ncbi:4-phosphoerythronate dehydrogenase PdxB [Larsenimonas salina]|uniref:4-phosphoerythronate dehydrogenase PdxB n=1 Tax=Larsenimonas salina TaxID=1295565 RepID=UPI002073219D|nr:4-phosphoerythronate dehydrogenase PdxB [Larsenimonas salina]MCM5704752.1 4-phosphoerythronate dehydrogenase PdxB [Larsenimonas salina]
MNIIADQNMPGIEATFGRHGHVTRVDGRHVSRDQLLHADVLLVRSVTQVDPALLEGTPVRFVGSATIGTDHLDLEGLHAAGIPAVHAPGCNAEGVVDYVLSSLLLACQREQCQISDKTIGVVGVGQVGGRLVARLEALGLSVLACDPPRAEREGDTEHFVALDELLARSSVICCHTPLVRDGAHPTHHLLDAARIEALSPGTWLLNAGRGSCIDTAALGARLERAGDLTVMLDVWENEPDIDDALRQRVDLATPHIAGYSLEGRLRGTMMLYEAFTEWAGVTAEVELADVLAPPVVATLGVGQAEASPQRLWQALSHAIFDVRRDADLFDRYCRRFGVATGFDRYRKEYPERREFGSTVVYGSREQADSIRALGFQWVEDGL